MKILVCGGRDYDDRAKLFAVLDFMHLESKTVQDPVEVVIHGAARGADALAGQWAHARGVTEERFPANWAEDGRAAGPIRNQRMLDLGKPDIVVAFPGGRGTADMVRRAKKAGVLIHEVKPREVPEKGGE